MYTSTTDARIELEFDLKLFLFPIFVDWVELIPPYVLNIKLQGKQSMEPRLLVLGKHHLWYLKKAMFGKLAVQKSSHLYNLRALALLAPEDGAGEGDPPPQGSPTAGAADGQRGRSLPRGRSSGRDESRDRTERGKSPGGAAGGRRGKSPTRERSPGPRGGAGGTGGAGGGRSPSRGRSSVKGDDSVMERAMVEALSEASAPVLISFKDFRFLVANNDKELEQMR
jgi:hypothetical protein